MYRSLQWDSVRGQRLCECRRWRLQETGLGTGDCSCSSAQRRLQPPVSVLTASPLISHQPAPLLRYEICIATSSSFTRISIYLNIYTITLLTYSGRNLARLPMFRAELFKLKILFSLPQTINLLFVKREIGSHILIRWMNKY